MCCLDSAAVLSPVVLHLRSYSTCGWLRRELNWSRHGHASSDQRCHGGPSHRSIRLAPPASSQAVNRQRPQQGSERTAASGAAAAGG
uniref:Uncharacterized protein n=1 Tax=Setaria italica TaxID=4555 RepID=K3YKI6_SETIT